MISTFRPSLPPLAWIVIDPLTSPRTLIIISKAVLIFLSMRCLFFISWFLLSLELKIMLSVK